MHHKVRTLIQDYLTDEQQGSSTNRNPISSINEILRDGKFNRDKIKVGLSPCLEKTTQIETFF